MSAKPKKKSIYTGRNSFTDRAKLAVETFNELTVKLQTLDTALLLLSSKEDEVLLTVFKHIMEYLRKQDENIAVLKEKNMLDLLMSKELFINSENVLIRRFALYLTTAIVESVNILQDVDTAKVREIQELCLRFYLQENDDFCIEYLSVILNKSLDDPQVAFSIVDNKEYMEKFFALITRTDNPDVLLHSIESLHKMLQVQSTEVMKSIAADAFFPIDRVLCELTNEFMEVRSAALKVVKILIVDTSETSPFGKRGRSENVLQQLTKAFCENALAPIAAEVIEVLSTAMTTEKMTQIFFEQNLFDKIVQNMEQNANEYQLPTKCRIIRIFAENAKYTQYLYRLYMAHITELFLDCLLQNEPLTHVITGLIRLMKFTEAANKIVAAYSNGVILKLIKIMAAKDTPIKTREQAAEFLSSLLVFAFHPTSGELININFPNVLADIFAQGLEELSIDFILMLLSIIETLAQNNEYRQKIGECDALITNLALLLKNSFSTAIVVNNIFRCLCTLIEEENVRTRLISGKMAASIKRGLKSLANLVKTSVTNFIMQTARFPEFVHEYIDVGVLEVLILYQKHAFCIPTWGPAIDAILAKCPSLKFCIRNQLSFVDSTTGNDFLVSKKKFEDFRVFQTILKEEVSPLHPILVVNFNRVRAPSSLIVSVPLECLSPEDGQPEGWCYSRYPSDPNLPTLLDELNKELEDQGLVENPIKVKRCIDFDNIAKRAKIIAEIVAKSLNSDLKLLDLNTTEECSAHTVKCHLKELTLMLHCNFIPLGMIRSGCQFERAVLFKALSDQIGLPCTLQRSVDGRILFNEVPLPIEAEPDVHCDKKTMKFMPWRMLRPTHVVDLMYNVGDLYPMQSRQALQYLRLY